MKYQLAYELLAQSKQQFRPGPYYPSYGYKVLYSSVYQNIKNSSSTSGSDSFNPGNSTIDMDLYFAIHKFDYTKSSNSFVTIKDIYDFNEESENKMVSKVIKIMSNAMNTSVIYSYSTLYLM